MAISGASEASVGSVRGGSTLSSSGLSLWPRAATCTSRKIPIGFSDGKNHLWRRMIWLRTSRFTTRICGNLIRIRRKIELRVMQIKQEKSKCQNEWNSRI